MYTKSMILYFITLCPCFRWKADQKFLMECFDANLLRPVLGQSSSTVSRQKNVQNWLVSGWWLGSSKKMMIFTVISWFFSTRPIFQNLVTLFMISEYRFYSFECMYTKFLLFSEIFSELLKLFFWIVFVQKNWMSSTSSCEMLLALYMLIYVVFLFWNIWQSTFVWENAFCFIDEN
jgi:hypothetical protein